MNTQHVFIGITGRINSGKDYLTGLMYFFFYSALNWCGAVRKDSFAAPIRDIARAIGWDGTRESKDREHIINSTFYHSHLERAMVAHLGNDKRTTQLVAYMTEWAHSHNHRFSYREFMQVLGNTARDFEPDYWVRKLVERAHNYNPGTGGIVITIVSDVRFLNEAQAMTIDTFIHNANAGNPEADKHVSEKLAMDREYRENCFVVFNNNGDAAGSYNPYLCHEVGEFAIGVSRTLRGDSKD